MVTHLKPDILECEVKWSLGSISTNKASGGNGIPAEVLKNPKKWCYQSAAFNISADLENATVASIDSITSSVDMNLSKFMEIMKDRRAWCAAFHGVAKSWTHLVTEHTALF